MHTGTAVSSTVLSVLSSQAQRHHVVHIETRSIAGDARCSCSLRSFLLLLGRAHGPSGRLWLGFASVPHDGSSAWALPQAFSGRIQDSGASRALEQGLTSHRGAGLSSHVPSVEKRCFFEKLLVTLQMPAPARAGLD